MITELYKSLFEVLFLHEYYLTDADQSSVFDTGNIGNASTYVTTRIQQGRPAVTELLQLILPASMQNVFRNQQLRLVNTNSGFLVAVRSTASLSNGTTVYSPAAPMPASCNLIFLIKGGAALAAITNGRTQREIDSLYYFSNASLLGAKIAPVLSNPIPAKVAAGSTYAYEQGELVDNNGVINYAYYTANGTTALFDKVNGDGFANESDRMLVGLRFTYTFSQADAVFSATFLLKDASGKTIKTINAVGSPLGAVTLDFSQDAQGNALAIASLPDARLSDPILYTLTVSGTAAASSTPAKAAAPVSATATAGAAAPASATSTANYSKTFNLVFYSDTTDLAGCWGLIQLQATVTDAAYSLIDASGRLNYQSPPSTAAPTAAAPAANAAPPSAPVFQIRCKSLPTFRRYVNNTGLVLKPPATGMANILQQSGNDLTTLRPVPLTYMPYFFVPNQWAAAAGTTATTATKGTAAKGTAAKGTTATAAAAGTTAAATATVYLPGPDPDDSLDLEGNQLFSLIPVPQSTLFPVVAAATS